MWQCSDDDKDDNEETRICYRCQQGGHIARDCNEEPPQKQCYCCNGFGHIARNCTANLSGGVPHGVDRQQGSQRINSQTNLKIQIQKGYLTNQHVDVIVVCSSSDVLRESVLEAAGPSVRRAYKRRIAAAEFEIFTLRCSNLPCKEILFLKWAPSDHVVFTEQTLKHFISVAAIYALNHNYNSIAFPSVGCGHFGSDPDFIAQTMTDHVKIENYPLNVAFIIHPQSHDVFNAFRNANASNPIIHMLPNALIFANNNHSLRSRIKSNTVEYENIVQEFDKTMFDYYKKIVCIELIQNERWHKQYLVHREDFRKRFNMNTEKFLYHGCSNTAADSIMEEYFNRSFAGKNGTVYGNGVYFSSIALYSHSFALPNTRRERCMFFARVLVGRTTLGDNTMKVCPQHYQTTTDGEHIYVTYHDTQAYGQYLIRYQ